MMIKKFTLRDRMRYSFDNTMSKGTRALIGWLFILSFLMIVLVSLFVMVTQSSPVQNNGARLGFAGIMWLSLLRTLDGGTMGQDTGNDLFLGAMLAITFGGIFFVSSLIGILNSGLQNRLNELRKGRSFVIEEGHTIILGWSPQVFTIISELLISFEHRRRSCIAILAEKDKVEMEDEIRFKLGKIRKTHIACRTGNPIDVEDLDIVNPQGARSIIILSPEGDDPDSQVVKTILAITNSPHRRPEPYHIVAHISNPRNITIARMVGKEEAVLILGDEVISRLTAQICHRPGLSVVFTELFNFGGDEIYFQEEPRLTGKSFHEAMLAYEDSSIIGLRFRDGSIKLNPPVGTAIGPGDMVVAISEDFNTVRLSHRKDLEIEFGLIREKRETHEPRPENTLVLGWNRRGARIINELDNYVAPGSRTCVVTDCREIQEELDRCCSGLRNQTVSALCGDVTDRTVLDGLSVKTFDHVITLSDLENVNAEKADARTLNTLLHLRDIADSAGHTFTIISEMMSMRNRELANVTRTDDFIISDLIVSLLIAQISQNRELKLVFDDLMNPEGSEIYIRDVSEYVQTGKPLNFYTVVEAAHLFGEVAIGYRLAAEVNNPEKAYGIRVNPPKSKEFIFSEGDQIIVIAESE